MEVNPELQIERLKAGFRKSGRLQIPDFLTCAAAERIHSSLVAQKQWNLVYRASGKHVDSDPAAVQKWPGSQRRKLDRIIHEGARYGFQYRYSTVPIYDIYHGRQLPGHFFNDVFQFLNSESLLETLRAISGDDTIGFADAQATRYGPGDFLTCHDDEVAGKNRRVAYVLNLTRDWRPDWGGGLCFLGADNVIEEVYLPTYNCLSLFRVPVPHFVSFVAPFAGAIRYSITGWLRRGSDPMLRVRDDTA